MSMMCIQSISITDMGEIIKIQNLPIIRCYLGIWNHHGNHEIEQFSLFPQMGINGYASNLSVIECKTKILGIVIECYVFFIPHTE